MTDTLLIWQTFEEKGFFATMRKKLKEREPKQTQFPTVESIPRDLLISHLLEELKEFYEGWKNKDSKNIQEEVCDIANLCGMIFVNFQPRKFSPSQNMCSQKHEFVEACCGHPKESDCHYPQKRS